MPARRNALGRGLGALIPASPEIPSTATRESVAAVAAGTLEIPVDQITPNPQQPRRRFDPDALERLAASIRDQGVIEPVVVRQLAEGRYELVVGERRWRASQLAGQTVVPAIVKDAAPRQSLELALVENVQRQDLNPVELALAFQALAEGGLTQEEIGRRVSLDRSTVSNHLRLLELDRRLQEDIELGRLSMGHAKAILQLASPERRLHLRERIVAAGLSVRAAEEEARRLAGPVRRLRRRRSEPTDPALEPMLDRLRDRLKARVRIKGTPARGRVEIEFFGTEELDRIASLILGDTAPREPFVPGE